MSLSEILQYIRGVQKKLTVFNPDPEETLVTDLAEQFQNQNVEVTVSVTSSGWPADVAVLERDGKVLTSVPTTQLQSQLAGTMVVGNTQTDPTAYRTLLEALKETTFTSADRNEMLEVSAEIEERALRTDAEALYAGFQQPEHIIPQRTRYKALADAGIDVHTFAVPGEPVTLEGVTHHAIGTDEIARHWFVALDGDEKAKTALLAEERTPGLFYGFWSDDPGIVDRVLETLETRV